MESRHVLIHGEEEGELLTRSYETRRTEHRLLPALARSGRCTS
jgi:hypothetical protein